MPQLTSAQATALAAQYTQLATTLSNAMQKMAQVPDVDLTDMQEQVSELLAKANGFENDGVAAVFNDSAAAYQSLCATTAHANEVAASIAAEVQQISKIAKIAASMLSLATALGSVNPAGVFTAIGGVSAAVSGH